MALFKVKDMETLMKRIETHKFLFGEDDENPWLNVDGTPNTTLIESVEEPAKPPVKRITKDLISEIVSLIKSNQMMSWFSTKVEEIVNFNLKTTDTNWQFASHPAFNIIKEFISGIASAEDIASSFKEDGTLISFLGTACYEISQEAEKRWAYTKGINWENFIFQSPVMGEGTRRFEVIQERFELDDVLFDLSLPEEILDDYKNLQEQQIKKFAEATDTSGNPRFTKMINIMTGQPIFVGHKYLENQGTIFKWAFPSGK